MHNLESIWNKGEMRNLASSFAVVFFLVFIWYENGVKKSAPAAVLCTVNSIRGCIGSRQRLPGPAGLARSIGHM